jgi:acetoacetyl-CoA reductase/3-oxoacyl-[acyl-carrier protein] reductase
LAPHVHVNCLLPGFTETEDVITRFGLDNPIIKADLVRNIPMGRLASTEDIARAALFLASSASDYMTGQLLCMNGGSFMY